MTDKIRIKKYQQSKVEEWSNALDIPVTRFVEDAIGFYLRYLEGKQPIVTTVKPIPLIVENQSVEAITIEVDNPEDFDGGIEL